ncbi:uncharacterized protein LOC117654362 [Thrips palmi]|uniref:Uncharacterized protein LOC117654362 n=1 Tax=Thrips palmi TaxID=161013 RepID=A0A6P9AHK8_THRPL|nr:uncharacterized protein LOC117654362 [Thrips palmi]
MRSPLGPWRPRCVALLLVLAELLIQLHAANRSYEVEFDSAECIYDDTYFGEGTGTFLRPKDKSGHSQISSVKDIIKELPNNTMIDTSLYEMHQKRYIQSFIKYRTNLCDYLRKENRPIFRSFKTYYKFPPSCPLVGYYKYDNRRFEDLQPPILPGPEKLEDSYPRYFRRKVFDEGNGHVSH